MSGSLFVVSAASGAGKTSLVRALLKRVSCLNVSVSHTTRAPRPNEQDGVDYFFVDEPKFKEMQQQGAFLESAEVFGHCYGTSKCSVESHLKNNHDVILEIDWQGARLIKDMDFDIVSIFILPPSQEALCSRLEGRAQDSDAVIERRLNAAKRENSHYKEYDYLLMNDDFGQTLDQFEAIIQASRLRLEKQQQKFQHLIELLIEDAE